MPGTIVRPRTAEEVIQFLRNLSMDTVELPTLVYFDLVVQFYELPPLLAV